MYLITNAVHYCINNYTMINNFKIGDEVYIYDSKRIKEDVTKFLNVKLVITSAMWHWGASMFNVKTEGGEECPVSLLGDELDYWAHF